MPLQIRRFDDISIHALREEGDLDDIERDVRFNVFLSTPSARRATKRDSVQGISPIISIHALREEGDGVSYRVPVGD